MSENTEMVTLADLDLGVAKYADDKVFDTVSSIGFLPRLQLFGANSGPVKEDKIPMGHWGLAKGKDDPIIDLTKEVAILVLSWRPKALHIVGDGTVVSKYKPADPSFKEIAAKSEEKDSGRMYGPEFLVWIPARKVFATLYMASKTARREAPNVKAQMKKFCLLKQKLIKTPKYSWHGPVATACSQVLEMPDMEIMLDEVHKFNNPPESEIEEAPPETEDRPR